MQLETYLFTRTGRWDKALNTALNSKQTLVFLFSTAEQQLFHQAAADIAEALPDATVVGASGAGEIFQDQLHMHGVAAAVIRFERTRFRVVSREVASASASFEEGAMIGRMLAEADLKGIFVLSEGLNVNGSQLTKGLCGAIPEGVAVIGGLAGDDDRFEATWVAVDGAARPNHVVAVGFYGGHIGIAYGSEGGWDRLGISRLVTRSEENVLYELDGQPALEVYKRYLGEKAAGLPAAGLLFPLELDKKRDGGESTVRTILGVDEAAGSITFAGDIPEGAFVALMKANFDRLVDGAARAAESADLSGYDGGPLLSIAVSCVGRRLVLKQRTEDELEAVLESLPEGCRQVGFYSYGEISPLRSGGCDLHNQTMTLTLLWESDAPVA